MGTACSVHQQTIESSPQLILDNLGRIAYPSQYDYKLYIHQPSKQLIQNFLVQESKEFLDEDLPNEDYELETLDSKQQTQSLNTKRNSFDCSITKLEQQKRGILRPSSQRSISSKQCTKQKKKVRFSKSRFMDM